MPTTSLTPSITQNRHLEVGLLAILILCLFPNFLQFLLYLPFRCLPSFGLDLEHNPASSSISALQPSQVPICYTPPFQPATSPVTNMSWFQKILHLPPSSRGSYLITDHITSQLPEISTYRVGILHLFVQHTSCALSMNENWDEDVRADMSDAMDRIVPTDRKGKGNLYRHSAEGDDDMPVSPSCVLISVLFCIRYCLNE